MTQADFSSFQYDPLFHAPVVGQDLTILGADLLSEVKQYGQKLAVAGYCSGAQRLQADQRADAPEAFSTFLVTERVTFHPLDVVANAALSATMSNLLYRLSANNAPSAPTREPALICKASDGAQYLWVQELGDWMLSIDGVHPHPSGLRLGEELFLYTDSARSGKRERLWFMSWFGSFWERFRRKRRRKDGEEEEEGEVGRGFHGGEHVHIPHPAPSPTSQSRRAWWGGGGSAGAGVHHAGRGGLGGIIGGGVSGG